MTQTTAATAAGIPVDRIRWKHIGDITVDDGGGLVFPPAQSVPGIYRFTIADGPEMTAVYVGQAGVGLVRRFRLYRSRGQKPSLPLAKKTTSRNARFLLGALADGRSVSVSVVDDHVAGSDGSMMVIDLADRAVRRDLEKRLIASLCSTGVTVLNRDGNPGWVRPRRHAGRRTP